MAKFEIYFHGLVCFYAPEPRGGNPKAPKTMALFIRDKDHERALVTLDEVAHVPGFNTISMTVTGGTPGVIESSNDQFQRMVPHLGDDDISRGGTVVDPSLAIQLVFPPVIGELLVGMPYLNRGDYQLGQRNSVRDVADHDSPDLRSDADAHSGRKRFRSRSGEAGDAQEQLRGGRRVDDRRHLRQSLPPLLLHHENSHGRSGELRGGCTRGRPHRSRPQPAAHIFQWGSHRGGFCAQTTETGRRTGVSDLHRLWTSRISSRHRSGAGPTDWRRWLARGRVGGPPAAGGLRRPYADSMLEYELAVRTESQCAGSAQYRSQLSTIRKLP
jgi:hypothetical protein